jgi:lipopolysaccharide export system permease protein
MFGFRKTSGLYILKEVGGPFLLALFVFTFVMLANQMIRMLDLIFGKGVSPLDILFLFASILPTFLIMMVPVSLMVGILLGLGRMSSDSEIVALKAGGHSLFDILRPIVLLAFVCFMVVNLMIFIGLPEGKKYFDWKVYEIARKKATIGIKAHVFNDSFPGMTVFVDEIDPQTEQLKRIMIHDNKHFEKPLSILAASGRITSDDNSQTISLHLEDGQAFTEGAKRDVLRTISFEKYRLNISLLDETDKRGVPLIAMPLEKLLDIERQELARNAGASTKLLRKVQAEIHRKFALPFSCLILALVAMPLGIFSPRSVRARGFVTGMAIFLVYYMLSVGGMRWSRAGVMPAWIGMWMANVTIGLFGMIALVKAARESSFKTLDLIGELVDRLSQAMGRKGHE